MVQGPKHRGRQFVAVEVGANNLGAHDLVPWIPAHIVLDRTGSQRKD